MSPYLRLGKPALLVLLRIGMLPSGLHLRSRLGILGISKVRGKRAVHKASFRGGHSLDQACFLWIFGSIFLTSFDFKILDTRRFLFEMKYFAPSLFLRKW